MRKSHKREVERAIDAWLAWGCSLRAYDALPAVTAGYLQLGRWDTYTLTRKGRLFLGLRVCGNERHLGTTLAEALACVDSA